LVSKASSEEPPTEPTGIQGLPAGEEDGGGLVGSSDAIARVRRAILRVAPLGVTVFVTGESGSGRKEVARAIHRSGPSASLPLVVVECGGRSGDNLEAVLFGGGPGGPHGLLGSSQIGTLFLAGIDEAALPIQRRLLQAIEDHAYPSPDTSLPLPVRVRLLAGAGADHLEKVSHNDFLRPLWERLALLEIQVPPLRERKGDIPELARHLASRLARRLGKPAPIIDPGAEKTLLEYSWPGNIRELRNVLEQTLILTDAPSVQSQDLPRFPSLDAYRVVENLKEARRDFERQHVERILFRYGGDKRKAAHALGVDVSSLYRKIRRKPPSRPSASSPGTP
jgi:DNA-binding NtrC family response regulator